MTGLQILKDLDSGKWSPLYLLSGPEYFQGQEILRKLKISVFKGENSLGYESWDGEHLEGNRFLQSLESMGGLFSENRLIVLSHLEKVSADVLEGIESYCKNPEPSTCLVLLAQKVDRRKSWFKALESKGTWVELLEPYDRDWPKWLGYFETRSLGGRKLDVDAWEALVEGSGRNLSILSSDLERLLTFIPKRSPLTIQDVKDCFAHAPEEDVFAFVDDILCRKSENALKRLESLIRVGENEVKLLALLVRQFRILENYFRYAPETKEPRGLAVKIGVNPFFIPQIEKQSKFHTKESLSETFIGLSETDYALKTGRGKLFESFLMPYLNKSKPKAAMARAPIRGESGSEILKKL